MTRTDGPTLVVLAAGLARRYGGCKPLAPAGPHGEAVIDLLASDALASGFGRIVLVLHPETGPAIRYHVERCWPQGVDVAFAEQRLPLGTVHAVLAARRAIEPDRAFAVANADDVYGETAMRLLVDHLSQSSGEHLLVAYRLQIDGGHRRPGHTRHLRGRPGRAPRGPHRAAPGCPGTTVACTSPPRTEESRPSSTGTCPPRSTCGASIPTSGRCSTSAMARSGLDEQAIVDQVASGAPVPKAEVLLPEVVAAMVTDGGGAVRVVTTDAHLVGVTHAADLPVVSAELARQTAMGIRPSRLWEAVGV